MPKKITKRPRPQFSTVERLAINVRRLRIAKFGTVDKACQKSGFTIPRWYRLEQGQYPGMVGVVLDDLAKLFGVPPDELVK